MKFARSIFVLLLTVLCFASVGRSLPAQPSQFGFERQVRETPRVSAGGRKAFAFSERAVMHLVVQESRGAGHPSFLVQGRNLNDRGASLVDPAGPHETVALASQTALNSLSQRVNSLAATPFLIAPRRAESSAFHIEKSIARNPELAAAVFTRGSYNSHRVKADMLFSVAVSAKQYEPFGVGLHFTQRGSAVPVPFGLLARVVVVEVQGSRAPGITTTTTRPSVLRN